MSDDESISLTPENKRLWWDEGEWVNEPDNYEFEYLGIKCTIRRIIAFDGRKEDGTPFVFGGYFCGYCQLPENHPWIGKEFDIDSDVHGGITFNRQKEDGHWVGFDCSHSFDIVPCMIEFNKKIREESKLKHPNLFKSPFWDHTYKNIDYVIAECKKLAREIIRNYPNHMEKDNEQMDIQSQK